MVLLHIDRYNEVPAFDNIAFVKNIFSLKIYQPERGIGPLGFQTKRFISVQSAAVFPFEVYRQPVQSQAHETLNLMSLGWQCIGNSYGAADVHGSE